MKQWTKSQYLKRVEEIEKKYEALLLHWRRFVSTQSSEAIRDMRNTKLGQRVNGLNSAFQMLHAQKKRDKAIQVLEEQLQDESCKQYTPYFLEAVALVLEDMKTDVVASINIQMMIEDRRETK